MKCVGELLPSVCFFVLVGRSYQQVRKSPVFDARSSYAYQYIRTGKQYVVFYSSRGERSFELLPILTCLF